MTTFLKNLDDGDGDDGKIPKSDKNELNASSVWTNDSIYHIFGSKTDNSVIKRSSRRLFLGISFTIGHYKGTKV